jgi:fructokinase
MNAYRLKQLMVTCGEQGACLFSGAAKHCVTIGKDKVSVDVSGAGDAVSAVMILGIVHEWPAQQTVERAMEFAALICTHQGAIPRDRDVYENLGRCWQL